MTPSRPSPAIDIEPLGEARWARIERAVFEAGRLDGAGAPAEARGGSGRLRIAATLVLAGAMAAVLGAATWRALVQPAAPAAPTRVETATIGSHVEFGESTVDVGPSSAVRLTGDDARGVVVVLDHGRVECDVTPRHGRPPFLVEAGPVEVRVVGTHFVVTRDGPKATVEVQRGEVEVIAGGLRALVDEGHRWPPPPDAAPPAPTHAPAPASPPSSARSPRARYEAASRLEATEPEAALAQYRDLARQGGGWGQNALFAAGRLEADRGRREEAARTLREYLARYPSGANANDARELLDRLR